MAWSKAVQTEHVRIGPITVLTLIAVICMAVLAVLAISTSNATFVLSERQSVATTELYVNETAAQSFVAEVDARLAGVRASNGGAREAAQAVADDLEEICDDVYTSSNNEVSVSASVDGSTVAAEFSCGNGRMLNIELAIGSDATYAVKKWRMAGVENVEQPQGNLWTGE